jgi:hypothetical protein
MAWQRPGVFAAFAPRIRRIHCPARVHIVKAALDRPHRLFALLRRGIVVFPECKRLIERHVGPTISKLLVGKVAEGSKVVGSFCGHGPVLLLLAFEWTKIPALGHSQSGDDPA